MEFNKIIAVSGKPGLFKVISQSKSAIIVTALEDDKRAAISATQNVSSLENISKGKINADYRMRFPNLKKGK
jgi:hypothetical protein